MSGCYYYLKRRPEVNEVVWATVCSIHVSEGYLKLKLPAYADLEVNMIMANLHRKRVKHISQHARVGQSFAVAVWSIDSGECLMVDVSKRAVNRTEEIKCHNDFSQRRQVANLLAHVDGPVVHQDLLDKAWRHPDPLEHLRNIRALEGVEGEQGVNLQKRCEQQLKEREFIISVLLKLETTQPGGIDDIKTALREVRDERMHVNYCKTKLDNWYLLWMKSKNPQSDVADLTAEAEKVCLKMRELDGIAEMNTQEITNAIKDLEGMEEEEEDEEMDE